MRILNLMLWVSFCSQSLSYGASFETVKSLFTEPLMKTAQKWVKQSHEAPSGMIDLECYQVLGNDLYIAVKQVMDINADLKTVESVIMDFEHYAELFPDIEELKITAREGSVLKQLWEQKIPIPFVPNTKYEMIYTLEKPSDEHRLYTYVLHKKGELKFSDGFILLKKVNDNLTRYIEYDFFDAEWGPAKVMGKQQIWYNSLEGIARSDLGIKFKSENAKWTHSYSRKEAMWAIRSEKIDDKMNHCIKNKKKMDLGNL